MTTLEKLKFLNKELFFLNEKEEFLCDNITEYRECFDKIRKEREGVQEEITKLIDQLHTETGQKTRVQVNPQDAPFPNKEPKDL